MFDTFSVSPRSLVRKSRNSSESRRTQETRMEPGTHEGGRGGGGGGEGRG